MCVARLLKDDCEMFEGIRRERQIKKALRAIARQRVALVLQPGGVVVVEKAPPDEEWFDVAARTCLIRGWVAVLYEAIPTANLELNGRDPVLPSTGKHKPFYRLTEGGWTVLNRSHGWVVATFVVTALGLAIGMASLIYSLLP